MDSVEDAIYECSGIFRGKLLRQFDSFVQDYLWRRVRAVHFMNGQPQNGAIDGRQPFEPPVIGMLDDDRIERGDVFRRAFKKFVRESARLVRGLRAFQNFTSSL